MANPTPTSSRWPGPIGAESRGAGAGPAGPRGLLGQAPRRPSSSCRARRAIEHEQELQRRHSYEHVMQREQARHVGSSRRADTALASPCDVRPTALRGPHRLPPAGNGARPRCRRREPRAFLPSPARPMAQVADDGRIRRSGGRVHGGPSHDAGYWNARCQQTACAAAPTKLFQLNELGVILCARSGRANKLGWTGANMIANAGRLPWQLRSEGRSPRAPRHSPSARGAVGRAAAQRRLGSGPNFMDQTLQNLRYPIPKLVTVWAVKCSCRSRWKRNR